MLRGLIAAAVLAAIGALVAWSADRSWWSAVLLQAEPLLCLLGLYATYVLRTSGRRSIANGLAFGMIVAFALVRIPVTSAVALGTPPEWSGTAARCAASLGAPVDEVTLLQWTLGGDADADSVRQVVATWGPDIAVIHHAPTEDLADALETDLGGDYLYVPTSPGGEGTIVFTRGVFHLCGDAERWGDEAEDGYTVAFAGTTSDTTFPLVVGALPGITDLDGWSDRMRDASARIAAAIGGLGSDSVILAADAPAPWTYRHLDARLRAAGLRALRVPPNWPVRIGRLPFLPIHPYDRVWAGARWEISASRIVPTRLETRGPVITRLRPRVRQARE